MTKGLLLSFPIIETDKQKNQMPLLCVTMQKNVADICTAIAFNGIELTLNNEIKEMIQEWANGAEPGAALFFHHGKSDDPSLLKVNGMVLVIDHEAMSTLGKTKDGFVLGKTPYIPGYESKLPQPIKEKEEDE